ncbi:MAG TPA: hypothetical protein VFX94_07135, partial [Burkholderiales bacterium]|nr:hypothetical protein [Burkholderiales bacterium]
MRGFINVEQLEEYMTRPSAELEADLAGIGDILVLGVGGKMGPTLARMAKRAAPGSRVIGVARFSEKRATPITRLSGAARFAMRASVGPILPPTP